MHGSVGNQDGHPLSAERRISRDGRNQRLSPYVTTIPESERPYRRFRAMRSCDGSAVCRAQNRVSSGLYSGRRAPSWQTIRRGH